MDLLRLSDIIQQRQKILKEIFKEDKRVNRLLKELLKNKLINICVIPARGGSKRVPKKNIKNFLGFPIIKYVIKNALKSNFFDKVIVSTDDKKIANLSQKFGAEILKDLKNLQMTILELMKLFVK